MLDCDEEPAEVVGKGHSAVRAMKRPRLSDGAPWQQLELFASPPWATRTLFENVLPVAGVREFDRGMVVSEPAAGMGHMSEILSEYSDEVFASDIYDYLPGSHGETRGIAIGDFLDLGWAGPQSDWIITNPPFGLSQRFLDRAMGLAARGVAILQRAQWLEGQNRYRDIYVPRPPSLIAPFVERVPMCEGGWDPNCSTATWYTWFVWVRGEDGAWHEPLSAGATIPTYLIPPGRKVALTRPSDILLAERCVPGFVPPSLRRRKGAKNDVNKRTALNMRQKTRLNPRAGPVERRVCCV